MKEIDFLPDWYKTGQKRQVNYRVQCIVLSGVFAVMTVWSLAASHSISKVKAELTQMSTQLEQAEKTSTELEKARGELKDLQGKIQSIEKIDSKIDVASVLAEISSLVDDMVVLSRIEFISEKLGQDKADQAGRPVAAVRLAQNQFGKKSDLPLGSVRFKVLIAGVAADASDVAVLVRRLEESPYFCQVVLSFSRNTQVGNESAAPERDADVITKTSETPGGAGANSGKIQVSEFQINCYLGNYHEL